MKIEDLAKALAGDVAGAIKACLGAHSETVAQQLKEMQEAMEKRFADLPSPEKGEKGDAGEVDMEAVKQIITDAVNALELPKGEKGDAGEVDYDRLKELIGEEIARIEFPIPEKGDKGDKGDSATVDMEEIKRMVVEAVNAIEIPAPKSAIDIEIEDGIDEAKVYSRGTYARYKGGLWRSFERTKGMKGWECIVAGIADISIDFDGERKLTITVQQSAGDPVVKEVDVPALIYREIWQEGTYQEGDCVTRGGALWVARKETSEMPGTSADWQLAVKRGGTGKSAYDLAREAGFTGTRQEWLDQIGKKPTVKVDQ